MSRTAQQAASNPQLTADKLEADKPEEKANDELVSTPGLFKRVSSRPLFSLACETYRWRHETREITVGVGILAAKQEADVGTGV